RCRVQRYVDHASRGVLAGAVRGRAFRCKGEDAAGVELQGLSATLCDGNEIQDALGEPGANRRRDRDMESQENENLSCAKRRAVRRLRWKTFTAARRNACRSDESARCARTYAYFQLQ